MTIRVPRTMPATLDHTFYVGEVGTNATGTVTVSIVDANEAVVDSGTATGTGNGHYTFPLLPQATLELLTATWTGTVGGSAIRESETVEIVGGHLFTLAEGRASDVALADDTKYTTAHLVAARLATEEECEEICDRAFTPRYRRLVTDGTGTPSLVLADNDLRIIRAARIASRTGESFVALTSDQRAALAITQDRVVVREDQSEWTEGRNNVIVEYEFGLDRPPADLVRASLRRFRWWLNVGRTTIPDRATSWTANDGTTYQLDMPSAYRTGMPDVDAVYERYALRSTMDGRGGRGARAGGTGTGAGAMTGRHVPASRPLHFDPQRGGLFHGESL